MQLPRWFRWHQRAFPSANTALVVGTRPILIDTGFGHDAELTLRVVGEAGVRPQELLVVTMHHHSDHVGGNHHLQATFDVAVAAHRWEATMVNDRDVDACSAAWLDQPVQPYQVDVILDDGETLDAGGPSLRVLHAPGHTLGHIALSVEDERLLILGDAVHSDDVAWINVYREGAGAVRRAMASIERLAGLNPRVAISGHGPAIADPPAAFASAHARYERWLDDPERIAWHTSKRIFAFALMIRGGLALETLDEYLLSCSWFGDISRHAMRVEPRDFVEPFLDEMRRSGGAVEVDGVLRAAAPHDVPLAGWARAPTRPDRWPPRAAEPRRARSSMFEREKTTSSESGGSSATAVAAAADRVGACLRPRRDRHV